MNKIKKVPIVGFLGKKDEGKILFFEKLSNKKISNKLDIKIKKTEKFIFLTLPKGELFSFMNKKIVEISDILILVIDLNKTPYIKLDIKKPLIVMFNELNLEINYNHLIKNFKERNFNKFEEHGGEVLSCEIKNLGEIKNVINKIKLLSFLNFRNDIPAHGYVLKSKYSKYKKFYSQLLIKNGQFKKIYLTETKKNIKINTKEQLLKILGVECIVGEKFIEKKTDILEQKIEQKIEKKINRKFKKSVILVSKCKFLLQTIEHLIKNLSLEDHLKVFSFLGLPKVSIKKLANSLKCDILYISNKKFNHVVKKIRSLKDEILFKIKITKIFKINKYDFSGGIVKYGKIKTNSKILIVRKNINFFDKIKRITINKNEVNYVKKGDECCIFLKLNKLLVGDVIKNI
ncbi:hypothetical protein [Candidatus Vidania fulgoroideorum]